MSKKIVHVFGNWKWTGPADPAVSLAAAQARHHDVTFVVGGCPYPDLENLVAKHAEQRGLHTLIEPKLRKHLDVLRLPFAASRLSSRLRELRPDIVHVHLDGDHAAARWARKRNGSWALVRSIHDGVGQALPWTRRKLLQRGTEATLCPSHSMIEEVHQVAPHLDGRVGVLRGAVDLDRFQPNDVARQEGRRRFSLAPDTFVFGIVARIQKHRRYPVLLEAFAAALEHGLDLAMVVLGRGTHAEELAIEPARQMGLSERIRFPGYQEGDAYVETLAALDAAIYLVPGTDGSCRAVREEMAMGLPVVVSQEPPLPEMVAHEEEGLVVEADREGLAHAMTTMSQDPSRSRRWGAAARVKALAEFSIDRSVEEVDAIYERALAMDTTSARGS